MASKQESQENRDKRWAKIDDLTYYFGKDAKEWIDLTIIAKDKALDTWRDKKRSGDPPYLCNKCNRYWAFCLDRRKKKTQYYLSKEVFNHIRCENAICKECE